jgi:hypothetical protein
LAALSARHQLCGKLFDWNAPAHAFFSQIAVSFFVIEAEALHNLDDGFDDNPTSA